jgi:glycosyltransferase involved in cell wall biosynthesis
MKILYLADIRFPLERANGIQTMETCHALAEHGHEVALVVRPDSQTPARDPFLFYDLPRVDRLSVEVAPIAGSPSSRRAGYLTFAAGRAIGRSRQDLIFTRDLGLAALLLRLPSLMRAPLVYEAHTIAADEAAARPAMLTHAKPATASKLKRLATRDERVWRHASGYVTITAGLRDALTTRFGPRPHLAVVPDGVRAGADRGQTRVRPGSDHARPFTVGYAGHLYPWKGVDIAIEVVAALKDTRGLIVGGHGKEPDLERVKAFVDSLDCTPRVTFTGMLPPGEVAARLQEADVLLLPNPASAISSAFTSPLKLFEYMASGRPIVASGLPSIREILTDDRNALLAEPGNPQAFTAAVRRIKEDPALGARLAAQAREDVAEYTWQRRAGRLTALFDAVREAAA